MGARERHDLECFGGGPLDGTRRPRHGTLLAIEGGIEWGYVLTREDDGTEFYLLVSCRVIAA